MSEPITTEMAWRAVWTAGCIGFALGVAADYFLVAKPWKRIADEWESVAELWRKVARGDE